jgi:hypothetical protein
MGSRTRPHCVLDAAPRYQLRFAWLHDPGRCITFPCDEAGSVDLGSLTELTRMIYLGARAMQSHYYSCPTVQRVH